MSEQDLIEKVRRRGIAASPRENPLVEQLKLNRQDGRALQARPSSGFSEMESLILAQNERWRHGLGMQVERGPSGSSGGRVSNT